MRQFIRNVAVVIVVLALAGAAFAGGKNGPKSGGGSSSGSSGKSGGNSGNHSSFKHDHNASFYRFTFSNCCCYRYGYCGWSSTLYSSSYCCNLYYDPCTSLWYFWCPAQSSYLPVSLWSSDQDED